MPVNGSSRDTIAIQDRGLAYGDGLFETIRIHGRKPLLFESHLDRMARGAERMGIPFDRDTLTREIGQFSSGFPDQGVLKIVLTRGQGGRGYMPPDKDNETTRILSLHPLPAYTEKQPEKGIDVFVCSQRLAIQPVLAGFKHLNRLEQVLASLEWPDDRFMEGMMLDMEGNVIEGTRSNVFWSESGKLMTPSVERCGVAGIMRDYLLEKIPGITEANESPLDRILSADEVFFCNSVGGVWPVNTVHDGEQITSYGRSEDDRNFSRMAASLFRELLESHEL